MRFNTGQVQELAGIRREQLRHWRKVLPPLAGRDGRTDVYTLGEALALAVLVALVEGLGISVSRLSGCAGEVFAVFGDRDGADFPTLLHVTDAGDLLVDVLPECDAFASVRVAPVFAMVRERLAPEQRQQLLLPLDR